ncbi:hypothetical protein PC129_g12855 [Phytophthora cactorum]|uniref:Uncharacterized protein n=1 Tax=Phytophthora cactorum TaxID=29920 RepID=A0A329RWB3_9STRA|nr:hypothetical protein Pcac1_g4364 [Phytophthora cactorum]KAG2813848.1 hypothetical protein PC112_g14577 [Phytophthora cactorum]KAG2815463.1 hypothetical protein PC111_g13564 [Phytophthora cactorum]KAG2857649.1 hypothetical protein PC113_g10496 [Phytophthora cactorum]KAG2906301.1 hypothetical protein PC114_g11172 [Phytophthora cactorum]
MDGPIPSVGLLSVLLNWLTEEGNYKKWCGGDKKNGETKTSLAKAISDRIRAKGIMHPPKTRSGITCESSRQGAIEERCPHFDVLKDVMDSSPSTRPIRTTEDSEFRGDIKDDGEEAEFTTSSTREICSGVVSSETSAQERTSIGRRRRRIKSIRPPSTRAASTSLAWNDINADYAKIKEQEQLSTRRMRQEQFTIQREEL